MATLSSNQQCGRCVIHGSGEIRGTVDVGGRERLRQLIRSGQHSARVITRARILLRTEEGWAHQVVAALDTSQRTVFRTKRRLPRKDWPALHDHPQANRYRKLDDKGRSLRLIALACSLRPRAMTDLDGLRLLADQAVELGLVESLPMRRCVCG